MIWWFSMHFPINCASCHLWKVFVSLNQAWFSFVWFMRLWCHSWYLAILCMISNSIVLMIWLFSGARIQRASWNSRSKICLLSHSRQNSPILKSALACGFIIYLCFPSWYLWTDLIIIGFGTSRKNYCIVNYFFLPLQST